MTRLSQLCLWVLLLTLLPSTAAWTKGYTPSEVPNVQLQDLTRFVSDPEGYFTQEERSRLDQALYQIRERHTAEVVLVVIPSIENDDPEYFTVKLFELWGIGKREDNNGLLILYKYGEAGQRIIRFETGYGLEGALPDITTKRLTNKYLVPAINEGRDAEGFLEAIEAIDQLLTEGYEARNSGNATSYQGQERKDSIREIIEIYLLLALVVGLLFSIGLGARWLRLKEPAEQLHLLQQNFSQPRILWQILILPILLLTIPLYRILRGKSRKAINNCPKCHTKGSVRTYTAPLNAPFLTPPQATEEQLHSVHYTVYDCQQCSYRRVIGRYNSLSSYARCPKCSTKSYRQVSEREARKLHIVTYKCFYCGHTKTETTNISDDSGFGGPFIGGGGGGFGGGGFSGGGFGGGFSGGGGSTTRF